MVAMSMFGTKLAMSLTFLTPSRSRVSWSRTVTATGVFIRPVSTRVAVTVTSSFKPKSKGDCFFSSSRRLNGISTVWLIRISISWLRIFS